MVGLKPGTGVWMLAILAPGFMKPASPLIPSSTKLKAAVPEANLQQEPVSSYSRMMKSSCTSSASRSRGEEHQSENLRQTEIYDVYL